jgi:hypothetical protein
MADIRATDPNDEARHVEIAESELREEFPEAPPDTVHAAVESEVARLQRAPVRDFVPLFVKRNASRALNARWTRRSHRPA